MSPRFSRMVSSRGRRSEQDRTKIGPERAAEIVLSNTSTGYPTPNVHTLHNQVHYAIGGTMKSSFSSANDPIFFLHHSFVDRIFEKWLRKYNKDASILSSHGAPLGHNRRDIIVPLFPVYTHEEVFKKSFELGYDFEDVDGKGMFNNDFQS